MKNESTKRYSTHTLALCAALIFASSGMSAEKDTSESGDVTFVKQEAAAGMALVKLAGLAAQRAVRPEVKVFAEMIVKDHTTANEELAKLAATKGVEISAAVAPLHAETFQNLEKTGSTDFDRQFLNVAESSHKKCVGRFEEAAQSSADNDVKSWAEQKLPVLKAHLAQAQNLSSGLPANADAAPSTPVKEDADNTGRNKRDRNPGTLTPLDQGNSEADLNTTAQIRREVIAQKNMSVNAQNVKIITNAGKVTLRGAVNSQEESAQSVKSQTALPKQRM